MTPIACRSLLKAICNVFCDLYAPEWLVLDVSVAVELVAVWLSGNALVLINIVALRKARLVLGWVTVRGYRLPSWYLTKSTQAYSAWPSLRG